MATSLDAEVRRADEDRWLASRFAPAPARARLIALYALNHEAARTADVVSDEAIGQIRLAWWRDAAVEACAGRVRDAHPTLSAFADAAAATPFPAAALESMIEAYARRLAPAPFASLDDADAHIAATDGALMELAFAACAAAPADAFIAAAASAWGLLGLARRARGLLAPLPLQAVLERAQRAYDEARALAPALPSTAFPAFGYVALFTQYRRAIARDGACPALLSRQLQLVGAAATGRI